MAPLGVRDWKKLTTTKFFFELTGRQDIVATRELSSEADATILEHKKIPFISYPYEWTFGQLKAAALLQLKLLETALAEDMILKDSTPFNIQWIGSKPIFIDIGSFTMYTPGEPWLGYQQFCRMFLYPLLLQAYKKIPFNRWLRAYLDGLPARECARFFYWKDAFKPGVLMDVFMQAWMEERFSRSRGDMRSEIKKAALGKELVLNNIRRLKKMISKLDWSVETSEWHDYEQTRVYSSDEYAMKKEFVRATVQRRRWNLVWDLGCNSGDFSDIASENANLVIAMDGDSWVVEKLFKKLQSESKKNILPLVIDLADPSPGIGWRGLERKPLEQRGRPDLVFSLALIHHLVITNNIPLEDVVRWLASLGGTLVAEFVGKKDPMVQQLLQNKDDIYTDYDRTLFEKELEKHFFIRRQLQVPGQDRYLYECDPRPSA